jgi:hypothetical protein
MDNQTLLIALAVVAVVYYMTQMKSDEVVNQTYVPPTQAQADKAIELIKNTDYNVVDALKNGTGSSDKMMVLFPGYFDQPTPGGGQGGWDLEQKAQDPGQPNNPDGTVKFIYMEDYTFFRDQETDEGLTVSDLDGAKQIPFARQSIGGAKTYYFKSFKVEPGTLMMITCYMPGSAPTYGFILRGRDCRDATRLLDYYPELAKGNNGIYWEGWPHWEIEWKVSAINKATLHKFLGRKFDGCLDTALGIGNSTGNMDDPNMQLGLHYKDGTRITQADGSKQMGRWIYDNKCMPIVFPPGHQLAGKQMYKPGGGGWGQSCEEAYKFCAIDTSVMVGVKPEQVDIGEDGIPAWVGIEGIYSGVRASGALADNQIGWTPGVTAPPPADAANQLTAPRPATETFTDSSETRTPMATASRFCDRSARDAADYSESIEDDIYRSGYSPFATSVNTSRHMSSFS